MIENYESCNGNAFNVGLSDANLTKMQLALKIKEHIPGLVIVQNDFKKDLDQRNYMVSNAKLEAKGWTPDFSIDRGIEELIKGYRSIEYFKNRDFTNI